jgi:AraC family transcriptional regulator
MNYYVSLITDTVEFIEANLRGELSLEAVSNRFSVSAFHFDRMFRTVAGRTLKQYILGRKLSAALEQLRETDEKVIDIAYDFGFQYPEVFSRAFKKQFGVSPDAFRKGRPDLETVPKASIVERSIVNYQGKMALKGEGVYLDAFQIAGVEFSVNVDDPDFRQNMEAASGTFLVRAQADASLKKDRFFTVVHCSVRDDGEYAVFSGMEISDPARVEGFASRQVPGGWYERFVYTGDMYDIRESFVDDLYRWVMVKEAELVYNGVGMLNIYEADYPSTHEVQILVPVQQPV